MRLRMECVEGGHETRRLAGYLGELRNTRREQVLTRCGQGGEGERRKLGGAAEAKNYELFGLRGSDFFCEEVGGGGAAGTARTSWLRKKLGVRFSNQN